MGRTNAQSGVDNIYSSVYSVAFYPVGFDGRMSLSLDALSLVLIVPWLLQQQQRLQNRKQNKQNKQKQPKIQIPPTGDPSEEAHALDWLISRQSKLSTLLFDEKQINQQKQRYYKVEICKKRKKKNEEEKSVHLCQVLFISLGASRLF